MLFFSMACLSSLEHSLSRMYNSGLRPLFERIVFSFSQPLRITAAARDYSGSARMAFVS